MPSPASSSPSAMQRSLNVRSLTPLNIVEEKEKGGEQWSWSIPSRAKSAVREKFRANEYGCLEFLLPRKVSPLNLSAKIKVLITMEVDEHYERFDMDNDFEGGKWIGDEFFYSNKKRKRQQTKDEQLYGYDSDLSDSERTRRGKGEKREADYSQPVGFVSSGVVKSTDDKPEDVEQAEHPAGGLGSKAGMSQNGGGLRSGAGSGAAGGLGFKAALDPHAMGSVENEDDDVVMPTSFGKRCSPVLDASLVRGSLFYLYVSHIHETC